MTYDDELSKAMKNAARYEAIRTLELIDFHDPAAAEAIMASIPEVDGSRPEHFDRFADQLIQAIEEADISIVFPERLAS